MRGAGSSMEDPTPISPASLVVAPRSSKYRWYSIKSPPSSSPPSSSPSRPASLARCCIKIFQSSSSIPASSPAACSILVLGMACLSLYVCVVDDSFSHAKHANAFRSQRVGWILLVLHASHDGGEAEPRRFGGGKFDLKSRSIFPTSLGHTHTHTRGSLLLA